MADKKVWFVTGCSKGMGNVLARRLLDEGYRVAATSRTVESLVESLGSESEAFLPLAMDVTDVKPGFIRTEFFGASYKTTAPAGSPYAALYEENMAFYRGQDGNQTGDPEKVAALYVQCAEMEKPWESLPMGTDCCTDIRGICAGTVSLMDEMLPVARTTDYDAQGDVACASNVATVQRYFELADLADQSQAGFDALIALYADDCESHSNDGSVSRGKAELVANTARFYDWTRGGERKHLYNVTRAEGDVVEADWAVSARIPDGTMVALKGHNTFEFDADHRIRKLVVENA